MNWILQASTTAVQHMLPLKGTVFERASPPRLQGWQPHSECAAPAKCAGLDDCLKGSPVGTLAHCPTVICPEARGMLAGRIPNLHIAPHPTPPMDTSGRSAGRATQSNNRNGCKRLQKWPTTLVTRLCWSHYMGST